MPDIFFIHPLYQSCIYKKIQHSLSNSLLFLYPDSMKRFFFFGVLFVANLLMAKTENSIKVACIGDSLTAGSHINRNKNYPMKLSLMLGERYKVKSFGVGGATLQESGDRPYMKQRAYQDALRYDPDIVLIMLGTNDSKAKNWASHQNFSVDAKVLINSFPKALKNNRIYVLYPPPVFGDGNYSINGNVLGLEIIVLLKDVVRELKLQSIDLHSALKDKIALFPDYVHPNELGASEIAEIIYRTLTSAKL